MLNYANEILPARLAGKDAGGSELDLGVGEP